MFLLLSSAARAPAARAAASAAAAAAAASAPRALNTPTGPPTVPPIEPEAAKRAPMPPPIDEQLPGGARVEDLKHVFEGSDATHVARDAEAGTSPETDVTSGRAAARAREMERGGAAEGPPTIAGEAATAAAAAASRLKHAAVDAYNKAADKVMGSLDGDTATRK
ncbi:hypothetical protein Rsub_00993 [Raphidocelis subcapitata]|uniref:Uncharacterized protein n=1 Tax=Raphidocelis subcapitata TaxID=307507 RepID=A0A2V0NLJ2_9CHLO|nr:hypothetical protein Rsub_00993 [Raphidocelis subcapitata]|eukprot:GBF88281.1 hypothetical protein Rsub_00993 [Raphidocelis subcapitata]